MAWSGGGTGIVHAGDAQPVALVLHATDGVAGPAGPQDRTWRLVPPLKALPGKQIMVACTVCDVPYAWPNVTATTRRLVTRVNGLTRNVDIPPSRYDVFSLAQAIRRAVNATWVDLYPEPDYVIDPDGGVEYDPGTNALGFRARLSGGEPVVFRFTGSTIGPLIGLFADYSVNEMGTTPDSDNWAWLSSANMSHNGSRIYVRSATLHTENLISQPGGMSISDVLFEVPVGFTGPWGNVQADLSNQRTMLTERHIQTINLRLTNRVGELLELPQGLQNWTMTLTFYQVEPIRALSAPADSVGRPKRAKSLASAI